MIIEKMASFIHKLWFLVS